MKFASVKTVVAIFFSLLLSISTSGYAADAPADVVRKAVDEAVRPMMAKEHIAGMAVGITVVGQVLGLQLWCGFDRDAPAGDGRHAV